MKKKPSDMKKNPSNIKINPSKNKIKIIEFDQFPKDYLESYDSLSPLKKRFMKTFRDNLDVLINKKLEKGLRFYSLTIDILDPNISWDLAKSQMQDKLISLGQNIELLDFVYLSVEFHGERNPIWKKKEKKKSKRKIDNENLLFGKPHYHIIFGVRRLIAESISLDYNIQEYFNSNLKEDIKFEVLNDFFAIKRWWNYCIKMENYKFHKFAHYTNDNLYDNLKNLELQYDDKKCFDLKYLDFNNSREILSPNINIFNIKTITTYFINLYFDKMKYKIFQNKIYTKILESKYSWKYVSSIKELKKNNLMIFDKIKEYFPQQLSNINTNEFINKGWNEAVEEYFENNNYLSELFFKTDAVEFTDGIYFMNENKFYWYKTKMEILNNKMQNFNCSIFFKKTYRKYAIKPPVNWIKALDANVIPNTNFDRENFCVDIGRFFHIELLKKENFKRNSMYVYGPSHTGKTTLITKIIRQLFGIENIGSIDKGDNFGMENIENKSLILADEYEHSKANRSAILKATDMEPLLMNKKGVQKYTYVNKAPFLLLSNEIKQNQEILKQPEFVNRFNIHNLTHVVTSYIPNIDEVLRKELCQILIYCNKMFFSWFKQNEKIKKRAKFFEKKRKKDKYSHLNDETKKRKIEEEKELKKSYKFGYKKLWK